MSAPSEGPRNIIVIGASAGGVHALTELVAHLPGDLPAAVFAVLHVGSGRSALPEILNRAGGLPAKHPKSGEKILPGRIYAAPPDRHLCIEDGTVQVVRGPRENGHRPAIDVLFRSAARWHGPRVIGVVLTGNLDDGTAGLLAIKKLGGVAVVQDPEDADYPSMPASALASVPVDHVAPLAELPRILADLVHQDGPEKGGPPLVWPQEGDVTEESLGKAGDEMNGGRPSGFTCPDCGGGLWETQSDDLVRLRCRTGHAFSPESLVTSQAQALEAALWAAVRSLEETASLARRMESRMGDKGLATAQRRYHGRAAEAERHSLALRRVLADLGEADSPP